ncbi:DUF2891 domain-containing protein [Chromobacterium haemolyticum]|nr:DUF2891 domain-containing protein [Chromobacterium haemolyticum]
MFAPVDGGAAGGRRLGGALLGQSARAHLDAGLPHVVSGHYTGEHWLGTFALLALDEGELE